MDEDTGLSPVGHFIIDSGVRFSLLPPSIILILRRKMKQVIVLRKDLNMRKGKMVAQGAHASLGAYLKNPKHPYCIEWLQGPFIKICVSVDSEEELLKIYKLADKTDLPHVLIKDAGKTEFKKPTYTAVAIGPGPEDEVNKITGELKLL